MKQKPEAGGEEKAYVPSNPPNYGLDNRPDWTKPTFEQFLDSMDLPSDTRWEDLSKEQRRWITKHYAWAPSNDPDEYVFSDLKLPHHIPTERYPNSVVKWGGVRAAAQRLPSAQIPENEVPKIQDHLAAHYHEFGRKAPWERDAASWERYSEVVKLLAAGEANDELLKEAASLTEKLFGEGGEEDMELKLSIAGKEIAVEGDRESIEAALHEQLAAVVEELTKKAEEAASKAAELEAKLSEAEAKLSDLEGKAKLGEQYIADLRDEVERLFVAAEGADQVEGYRRAVELLAARGDVEALKAERDRLRKKLESEVPNERLSQDAEDGAMSHLPPRVDEFKQRD